MQKKILYNNKKLILIKERGQFYVIYMFDLVLVRKKPKEILNAILMVIDILPQKDRS